MANQITSGEWVATKEPDSEEWGVDAGRWGICICADAPGDGTAEGNAKAIAALPALLDFAKRVAALPGHGEYIALIDEANAEIVKAGCTE